MKEKDPAKLVQKIAELKAKTIAAKSEDDSIIIAADSMVFFDGKAFGKPTDKDDARMMLRMLSGSEHTVYTGLCIINKKAKSISRDFQSTKVRFRKLTESEIEWCVSFKETLGGAGAYVPQTQPMLFEGITGSYDNVNGLPVEKLIPLLRENGVNI